MKKKILLVLLFVFHYLYSQNKEIKEILIDSIPVQKLADTSWRILDRDFKKAYNWTVRGLDAINKIPPDSSNVMNKIKLLHIISHIECKYLNDYYKSTKRINQLLHLSDSINFKRGIALGNLILSNIYFYQFDNIKSLEVLEKSVDIAKSINDSSIIFSAYLGIAGILANKGKHDSSNVLLNKTQKYSLKHNRPDYLFILYEQKAENHLNLKNYDSSIYYYNKTLNVSKWLKNKYNILSSELNLEFAIFQKDSNYYPINNLKRILRECKENKFHYLVYCTGYAASYICEIHGNYLGAFNFYKEADKIEDSITNRVNVRHIAELESAYKIQKKELENKKLSKLNSKNILKLKKRKNIILCFFLIIIQSFILILIIYRKYKTIKIQERKIYEQDKLLLQKEKEYFEHKVELQNKELTSKVMKIYQYNELNQKLISEINETKKLVGNYKEEDLKNKLQSLTSTLKTNSNKQMWNEFEKTFYETHPVFLEKLSKKYQKLTPNEIKLCIFLFLNLRTKEISIITQQSIDSINKARTRLRKKLDLYNTNKSLTAFLRSI